ncbi:S-norcoclaurine synthase [Heracleum sosnowskyi]|uniref:S-norcoclaurine synthase n=1 Tax=Heracleum sosnowskyi TaxID=360622 RepID=A0AAD8HHR6_9APIA|nr:S-norcoclaurine synthase [Heracleum sosnowskyi]
MFGTVSGEIEVKAAASVVWEVYGTLEMAAVVEKGLAEIIQRIEVVEGDGSAGTVLNIVFQSGGFAFPSYKEKYIKVDNEKRVKEAEVVEGGYLEIGFNKYLVRFEVIEKDEESCITKATVEYDLKEDFADNASFVSIDTYMAIMNLVVNHVLVKSN